MKCKVLLDTNVLIAASTSYVSRETSIRLEHPFYKQSAKLIEFLRENLAKRVGIVTRTIELQALRALEDAVKKEIVRQKMADRSTDFLIFSVILNSCEQKLHDVLGCLVTEPVDEESVNANYSVVDKMYVELAEQAVHYLVSARSRKWAEAASKRFRGIATRIYRERQEKEDYQLTNLIRKPVEPSDKRILAEAIYLSMFYNQTDVENVAFYLASTDHHFSTKRWIGGIVSNQITNRIKDKFDIICDWPQQITELAGQTLKLKPPEPTKVM